MICYLHLLWCLMMIFIWRFILNNYYYFNLFKSSGILISMCWLLEMAAWSGLTVRLLNILECRTSSFYPIFFMEKFHPKTILKHNLPVNLDILEFLVHTLHPTTLTKKKKKKEDNYDWTHVHAIPLWNFDFFFF